MSKLYFLDAEFQTYMAYSPCNSEFEEISENKLKKAGYISTDQKMVLIGGTYFMVYTYQFLLSLGIMALNADNTRSYMFARFPLLFDADAFSTPRILVPKYTFAGTRQAELTAAFQALNINLQGNVTFPDFRNLTASQLPVARSMFDIYTEGYQAGELKTATRVLLNLKMASTSAIIINQGFLDLIAIRNTMRVLFPAAAMGIKFNQKNIEPICKFYAQTKPQEVANAQLETVKKYLVGVASLGGEEGEIMGEIVTYMKSIYGDEIGDLTGHNPLVDSMFVYLVLEGFKKMEAENPEIIDITTKPGRGGRRKRQTKQRRYTRRIRKN